MSDIYLCKDCKHQHTDDGACDSCTGIFDVKNNRHEKPTRFERKDRPRICEVLGVEVGEEFTFPYPNRTYDRVFVKENGQVWERVDRTGNTHKLGGAAVCWLINNADSIKKQMKLTDSEVAICKALGATWVGKTEKYILDCVHLWANKPHIWENGDYGDENDKWIGAIESDLFPSVRPGHLIEVPHD